MYLPNALCRQGFLAKQIHHHISIGRKDDIFGIHATFLKGLIEHLLYLHIRRAVRVEHVESLTPPDKSGAFFGSHIRHPDGSALEALHGLVKQPHCLICIFFFLCSISLLFKERFENGRAIRKMHVHLPIGSGRQFKDPFPKRIGCIIILVLHLCHI